MRKRLLAILLALTMCFSLLPLSVQAEEIGLDDPPAEDVAGGTEAIAPLAEGDGETWDKVEWADIQSGGTYAITMEQNGKSYLLPNAEASSGPKVAEATVADGTLTSNPNSYGWTFVSSGDGFLICNATGSYLNASGNTNNGIKISDKQAVWQYNNNLKAGARLWTAADDTRYLCVYNAQDWRSYKESAITTGTMTLWHLSSETEITPPPAPVTYTLTVKKGETEFTAKDNTYTVQLGEGEDSAVLVISGKAGDDTASVTVKKGDTAVDPSESSYTLAAGDYTVSIANSTKTYKIVVKEYFDPSAISTISDVRTSGVKGQDYTVTGVVLVNVGNGNLYIHDGTAGIDLNKSGLSNDANAVVGKTVTATGKLSEFNGLLQLGSAEITASDTTIARPEPVDYTIAQVKNVTAVTNEDQGKLVKITGAKVTAADANNVTLSDGANKVNIYKCPTKEGLVAGAEITVIAVVSTNSKTGQLLVGSADDITITKEAEPEPEQPDDPGEELYKPADGDKVVIYHASSGTAMSSTLSGTRLAGVDSKESGVILTVSVRTEGDKEYYTFTTNDGKLLATGTTGGNLTLEAPGTANKVTEWVLEEKEGGWNIYGSGAVSNNKNQCIEYYQSNFTTYGYSSSSTDIYLLKFYDASNFRVIDWTVDTEVEQTIAQWGGALKAYDNSASVTSIYGDLLKVGDELDNNSKYTVVKGGENAMPLAVSTAPNYYMGGTGLQEGDCAQFATSSKGWGGMELSFRMRVTNAGANEWQVQYSTDGTNFFDFDKGSYSASYTSYAGDTQEAVTKEGSVTGGVLKFEQALGGKYVSFKLAVPVGAENADELYIRLVSGNEKISGATGAASGTIRIDTVKLVGSPVDSKNITGYVAIDPESDEEVGSGAEIKLTAASGATVHYGWADNATGEVTYTEGNTATVPDTLPATLFVYASSTGKDDSVVRRMTYLPAAVASVQMSPNGGGVYLGGGPVEVVLTTATSGATIYYSLGERDSDGNLKYEKYIPGTTKITLTDGFGALTVSAYAVLEGFSDSAVTTRTFTQRAGEKYKLFFGQMHSHTSYSDGAGTAAEAFSSVKALDQETWNMDFLSVTDHSNSFDDAGGSKKLADVPTGQEWNEGKQLASNITDDSFVGIFGYEMTWSNGLGHINTFNTPGYQDRTQTSYTTYSTALQNYYEELKTVPTSISQFNHPGTTFGDFSDFAHYDEEIDRLITLIEVGNGEGAIGSSGYFPSYEYYTRALDKGWHVAPTNNQDNHKGGWGTSNTGRDVVLVDELTEDAIYDAMRNYRVYATEDLNLEIYYTFDGQIMGSILDADGYAGKAATISVALNDPNNEKATTVQVIVNGGKVLTQKENVTCNETVTFEIESPADYAYYYIKIVQGDGDIAVTAPVWVGAVEAVGITSLKAENALTVVGEEQTFNLELFNNEKTNLEVTSIVFTNKETGKVLHTATDVTRVPRTGTASTSFTASFDTDGVVTVLATVKGTLNGVEKTYTQELELNVMPQDLVKRIVVDGSHYNDYVTGYYGGRMGNMTTIAAGMGVEVTVAREITAELLNNCELLVISAPARKSGTDNAGGYKPSSFEDSFIELVKNYVASGGSVVVCGLADYQDKGASSADGHAAAQINKLLAAIGSTMSINDDEVYDKVHNGGQEYRLYPEIFNMDSKWCKGIITADSVKEGDTYQTYSQYSGCTVNLGEGTWLVKGFDTTYSIDSDTDGKGGIPEGEGPVYFLACEDTASGGTIFAAGAVCFSNFEVAAELDNIWDLPYANRTIFENILGLVRKNITITPIADTRKAPLNKVFTIEGYVTSGTANPNTTFFDSIYVQDETGGTDVFPYAAAGLAIGAKVRVLGYTDAYQGDRELQVISLEVLDAPAKVYTPKKLTTAQATDYDTYGGQLVSVSGKVSDIVMAGGRVSQFKVTDSSNKAATVFIDGYITNPSGVNNIHTWLKDGQTVSAVGLLYSHPEGDSDVSVPVLRVRNCDEITRNTPESSDSGGGTTGSGTTGSSTTLPVSTGSDSDNGTVVTETTAVIESKVEGTAASAAVSEKIAQEIVNQAVRNDTDAVVITPDMGGDVTKADVSIPASAVAEIAEKTQAELRVETPVAGVTIPNKGLSELAKAGGEVNVSAERSGNTVEVAISSNGKPVDKVTGGVILSIPQENCTPGTVAMLVREDGTTEVVRQSVASGDGQSVAVPLDGSAKVVIVDNSASFSDVSASNWAADAVAFASSHELMNGTGDGVFDPNVSMTRGMLAKVLHNLDNNPQMASGTGFADVADSAWYADAVAWAEASGIIMGYSDGRFGSNDPITREQLAVMLHRYVGSPAVNAAALSFADAGDISSYAETAMAWAVSNGILNGKGGGILDPKGAATRAEVAQMMLNFVSSRA